MPQSQYCPSPLIVAKRNGNALRQTMWSIPAAILYASVVVNSGPANAWVPAARLRSNAISRAVLHAALPKAYKEIGESLILQAGTECGAKDDQLSIEWKGERIIVTVHGDSYVSDPFEAGEGDDDGDSGDGGDEEDEVTAPEASSDDNEESDSKGVDVTELARAINRAFDDGETGLAIAENHEIEVTTPGSSDELSGIMFEAYKGFDIVCRHVDPKSNKEKQIDGRLVERNDQFTVINIKGRMKKLKNDNVVSVRLPKAKKEKGVK